jgi:hypothetical protein
LTVHTLQEQLSNFIDQAIEIRFETEVPSYDANITEVHRTLIEAQINLAKLERLLSNAVRAKSALDRKVSWLKLSFQESWDRAISNSNKRPTLGDYATGKEKAAEANLATLEGARVLRKEEDLQAFATEAVDVIRLHYYGLDKLRQDLRKRLDLAQAEYQSAS